MADGFNKELAYFSKTLFARQANSSTFFDGRLLEDLHRHFKLDRSSITIYDENAMYLGLYMLDFDGSDLRSQYVDEIQYKYSYRRNPVYQAINRHYRHNGTAFGEAPIFQSGKIIAPAEYDQNEHIQFLSGVFGGTYYNAVIPFGRNGRFRLSFHKTRDDGDFTDRELDLLSALYHMLAAGYDAFGQVGKMRDELKMKSEILDENRIGLMVLDEELDTIECNRHMKSYLPDITHTSSEQEAKAVLLDDLASGNDKPPAGAEALVKNYPHYHVRMGAYPFDEDNGTQREYYYVNVLPDKPMVVRFGGGNPALSVLSAREREIADLLLKGASYQQIASELFISLSTVRNHVQNIFKKLGIKSQRQLMSLYLGIE